MVETISPVVHGGRNGRYLTVVGVHALGATASASLMGGVLGSLGLLLGAPWGSEGLWLLASVACLYGFRDLAQLPVPLPDLDRQVPEWWRTFYSHHTAAFLYGLGLGAGFLTYLSFGTLAVVGVGVIVLGNPFAGALLMGVFGLARGLSVLVAANKDVAHILDRLESRRLRRSVAAINGVALLGIAFLAIA